MLIKLTPEQIIANWSVIFYAVSASLPPISEYSDIGMVEIKRKLLSDEMQCWAVVDKEEKITLLATTVIVSDLGTGIYNLLIYSLFAVSPLDESKLSEELFSLKIFAKENKCKKIIAYSNIPKIINLVKNLGGRVDYQLISLEVK